MWWLASTALAGLGPMDTMVLFNADSPEATTVAAAYAEARHLPDSHRCGLTGIDPAARTIDADAFESMVRAPLDACLDALPDPLQIDVLVTVRGLPYRVDLSSSMVGFEAALQVLHALGPDGEEVWGRDNDSSATVPNPTYIGGPPCNDAELEITNPFGTWYRSSCTVTAEERLPRTFDRARSHEQNRFDFTDNLLIVGRLDGFDFNDATALVDRAMAAETTAPDGEIVCMHSADNARGARDPECEYTTRHLADVGAAAAWIPEFDGELSGRRLSALFTGAASFRDGIAGNTWVPGAIACNLTSFGAVPNNFFCDETGDTCPAQESQTSIARFVRAGVTAVHGTVAEPLNNTFPDASTLLLYQEGYTVGEAFLFSSEFLYWYNLVLGDPLVAPYAVRPEVTLDSAPTVDAPLVVSAEHPDGIALIELFVGDERVAMVEDAGELTWQPSGSAGTELDVMVVATAANADLERPTPEWDVSEQRVRAQPKGWWADTVTIAQEEVTAAPGECGCASNMPMNGWWLVPVGLLVFHRRRQTRYMPPALRPGGARAVSPGIRVGYGDQ